MPIQGFFSQLSSYNPGQYGASSWTQPYCIVIEDDKIKSLPYLSVTNSSDNITLPNDNDTHTVDKNHESSEAKAAKNNKLMHTLNGNIDKADIKVIQLNTGNGN